jgi:glycosyltransferase involved in cell wall biosynthesis
MIFCMVSDSTSKPPVTLLINGLHSKSGGGVTYLNNILPLLGCMVDVDVHLCIHKDQREILNVNVPGVTVHELSFATGFWKLLWREQIDVPRLAKRIGAMVTFSPANYGPIFAPKLVILLRNSLSVGLFERRISKISYWLLLYLATSLSLLFSIRAIAVSDYARATASGGLLNIFKGRISIVPHGVDERFSESNNEVKRESFVLAVSDLYVQKNFHRLLGAISLLREKFPTIMLKIAGRAIDEDYYASLLSEIEHLGISDHVEFLGHVTPDKLVDLYQRCGVFIFPSLVETFGNSLVEAMASGAPIATSRAAAMPEVAGEGALYFDPTDIDDIAEILGSLLESDKLRRDLGQKALQKAELYSWPITANKTLAVLRDAAS